MTNKRKNDDLKPYNRDKVLSILSNVIKKLDEKLEKGRIVNLDNEKIRIQYYKALIYSMDIFNKILKDKQIDNLQDELESIRLALINNEHARDKQDSEQSENVEQVLDEVKGLIDNA
jgi:hypothetical protein